MSLKNLGLLLVASIGMVIVLGQPANNGFEPGTHHGNLSSHGMALAENLGAWLAPVDWKTRDTNGVVSVGTYTRYSPVSFLAIKAAAGLGGDRLTLRVHWARQLMNLCVIGAMMLAFLCLFELTYGRMGVSVIATLLSFSGLYVLLYADMIFVESPTLLGFMLVAHGIVLYERDLEDDADLFLRIVAGLLLGWQVLALVAVYFPLRIVGDVWRKPKTVVWHNLLHTGLLLVAVCVVLVAFFMLQEQRVSRCSFGETSTFRDAKIRLGMDPSWNKRMPIDVKEFLVGQKIRVEQTLTPVWPFLRSESRMALWTIPWFLLAGYCYMRFRRMAYTALWLSGPVWAFGMVNFTYYHDFQSLYYLGTALCVWLAIVLAIDFVAVRLLGEVWRKRVVAGMTIGSAVVFLCSALSMALIKDRWSPLQTDLTEDFQRIRVAVGPAPKVIGVNGLYHEVGYGMFSPAAFLPGHTFTYNEPCDFVLTRNPQLFPNCLTPQNRGVYLFAWPKKGKEDLK